MAGLLNIAATVSLYRAFTVGKAALVAPIAAGYPALTILLSLLSGERPGLLRSLGFPLVLAGMILACIPQWSPAVAAAQFKGRPRPCVEPDITYKAHRSTTGEWVTIVDKGHLTALDNPEVRALAAKYGNADRLLSEDWVPEIPGINARGRYEDYARDPWKYADAQMKKILSGTYEHYYPPARNLK